MSNKVRIGIIGVGGMGSGHAEYIKNGKIKGCELTAVCDIVPEKLKRFSALKTYTDSREIIRSGEVDAVIIATPHYFHTTIGIDALEQGLHVLVEKPISVHKADCERLIAAHKNKDQVFSAMFNQRTDPHYQKLKAMIENGELGEITRVNWVITDWFRPEAYYASGGWRATWKGEGGGVLTNQCPHQLDLMQWLFGMPSKVRAFCKFGAKHNIEVEDQVTAYLEYPNGATGIFITTTGEAPGVNRLEVCGERGRVTIEGGNIRFVRNEVPTTEFSKTTDQVFATPPVWWVEIPVSGHGEQHPAITQNFVNAILHGTPLLAPAEEGIKSVELANAMLYSTLTNSTVEMPLDGAAYEKELKKLIENSTFEKKAVDDSKVLDLSGSVKQS
ncbi:MAG: Gfo/Idh/MocA family oxidoreductase [Armatimonadota bacterium]